ncbi:MAG: hypothetical protein L3J36_04190 [Rhodobacteraceae bacterium]|nr:hypothetical protein [Paracoccaceae bacterium]
MRMIPVTRPDRAAPCQKIGSIMDVILHIGAHRCATTSFQNYLRQNVNALDQQGIGFWGPRRTRNGLFRGIVPKVGGGAWRDQQRRGMGRVRMHLARSSGLGVNSLLVTDENLLGSVRENLRFCELYSGAGERMARYGEAFDGRIRHILLNVRSLDTYWASALGFSLTRGRNMPGQAALVRLATAQRSWRDVITDVACAIPGATIWIAPFEVFAGRPEAQLSGVTGINAPKTHARERLNTTLHLPALRALAIELNEDWDLPEGDGRWMPFAAEQVAALRENYADDLMWLTSGAEGLARLLPDPDKIPKPKTTRAGTSLPPNEPSDMTRGRTHDRQERYVARAR